MRSCSTKRSRSRWVGIIRSRCRSCGLSRPKHGPVALVHVDAHADVNDEMFGERETHGTVFRRAYEEGLINPSKTFQIGLRGTGYEATDFTEAQGWGFQHASGT